MSATYMTYRAQRRPSLQPKVVTDEAPTDAAKEEPPMLLSRLRGEWTAIRDSAALLRRARNVPNISEQAPGTVDAVTKEEVVKVYTSRHRSCNAQEDAKLVEMTLTDFFDRADLSRCGRLGEVHWLHDGLLQSQAPSLHALLQVNAKLELWLLADAPVQSQLLDLFLQSCEGYPLPWLTPAQMRRVAERWISQGNLHSSAQASRLKQQSISHLQDLLSRNAAESESGDLLSGGLPGLSYYDFLTHMLACRKARVQVWHYDLSHGRAKWLSALVGQELTGVWHTSIVVYNKEYWYGGRILICEPGASPFGAPDKILDLPGLTTRTDCEFLKFLRNECVGRFREDNYDVLTNNCNHFTDAVSLFLLNRHLPEEVLRQPALEMGTRARQIVRPLLNNVLGGFRGKGLEDDVKQPEVQDAWSQMAEGNIVIWEFREGWTRVARLLVKTESSCDLRWLDTSSGELRLALGVERAAVHRWRGTSTHEATAHMPRRVQEKPCPKRRLRPGTGRCESRQTVMTVEQESKETI